VTEPVTVPPPSPEARALRTVGRELDALGDVALATLSKVETLQEMGETDAATLRSIDDKIGQLITALTDPERGLLPRVERLEAWRGDHSRQHAAAE
jgi:hypothetical protein